MGPFSSLAINYPRNSILVTLHRFANGRSDKNLFFRAHKYYTDKSESEGYKMLSKSLSPRTFRFITAFDRLSWTRCWGFLSAYLQAGKLFVHFINLQRRTINYKSCRERVFVELARYIVLELKNFLRLIGRRKEGRVSDRGRGEKYIQAKLKASFSSAVRVNKWKNFFETKLSAWNEKKKNDNILCIQIIVSQSRAKPRK